MAEPASPPVVCRVDAETTAPSRVDSGKEAANAKRRQTSTLAHYRPATRRKTKEDPPPALASGRRSGTAHQPAASGSAEARRSIATNERPQGRLQFTAWRELCLCPVCGQALMSCHATRQQEGIRHCAALLAMLSLDKKRKMRGHVAQCGWRPAVTCVTLFRVCVIIDVSRFPMQIAVAAFALLKGTSASTAPFSGPG